MILDEIAEKTRQRVKELKKAVPPGKMREKAEKCAKESDNTAFPFEKALKQSDISFICEVKKASPSKGLIAPDFPYMDIAQEYERAGAAAISVLTEPYYFQGKNEYLKEISETVNIPVLRKDFTVDEYMIYEAKVLGASAVLLICAILEPGEIKEYLGIARSLGLSAIVEAHTAEETETALSAGAGIIGVNNRNLKDFTVDIETSVRLRSMVPESVIYVAESGIKTPGDIQKLRQCKADAVLIGETFMRSGDKKKMLAELRGL